MAASRADGNSCARVLRDQGSLRAPSKRPRPKPVKRNRKRSNSDFAHALLSAMSNDINLDGSEGVRERQFEGERGASLRFLEAQQSFDTTSPTL